MFGRAQPTFAARSLGTRSHSSDGTESPNRTIDSHSGREEHRIAQRFKDGSGNVGATKPMPHVNHPLRPIRKADFQKSMFDDSDFAHAPRGMRLDRWLYASGAMR